MIADVKNDEIIFSNGKTSYANRCIVGIDPDLEVSYGYDGALDPLYDSERFTPEERVELADYMIGLWERYKIERAST